MERCCAKRSMLTGAALSLCDVGAGASEATRHARARASTEQPSARGRLPTTASSLVTNVGNSPDVPTEPLPQVSSAPSRLGHSANRRFVGYSSSYCILSRPASNDNFWIRSGGQTTNGARYQDVGAKRMFKLCQVTPASTETHTCTSAC